MLSVIEVLASCFTCSFRASFRAGPEIASHTSNFRVSGEYSVIAQCFVVFQIADGPHEDVDAILTKKRLPIARFSASSWTTLRRVLL